ncbi:MAG: DUF4065 domain-containing protein [Armatimonadota bacterium]|nr:DUF4065 domain-containing protein [Armatimonadota bacterium]
MTCFDVADYFLATNRVDEGDLITNLKLQKLCYYAQGLYLALYDKPLFEETIEAWMHGPVIPELYHKYKVYGQKPIPPPEECDLSKCDADTLEVLEEVSNVYGQFSAWKLASLTHATPPYIMAGVNGVITPESMRSYFKTQLVDAEA